MLIYNILPNEFISTKESSHTCALKLFKLRRLDSSYWRSHPKFTATYWAFESKNRNCVLQCSLLRVDSEFSVDRQPARYSTDWLSNLRVSKCVTRVWIVTRLQSVLSLESKGIVQCGEVHPMVYRLTLSVRSAGCLNNRKVDFVGEQQSVLTKLF